MDDLNKALQTIEKLINAAYAAGVITDVNSSAMLNGSFNLIRETIQKTKADD